MPCRRSTSKFSRCECQGRRHINVSHLCLRWHPYNHNYPPHGQGKCAIFDPAKNAEKQRTDWLASRKQPRRTRNRQSSQGTQRRHRRRGAVDHGRNFHLTNSTPQPNANTATVDVDGDVSMADDSSSYQADDERSNGTDNSAPESSAFAPSSSSHGDDQDPDALSPMSQSNGPSTLDANTAEYPCPTAYFWQDTLHCHRRPSKDDDSSFSAPTLSSQPSPPDTSATSPSSPIHTHRASAQKPAHLTVAIPPPSPAEHTYTSAMLSPSSVYSARLPPFTSDSPPLSRHVKTFVDDFLERERVSTLVRNIYWSCETPTTAGRLVADVLAGRVERMGSTPKEGQDGGEVWRRGEVSVHRVGEQVEVERVQSRRGEVVGSTWAQELGRQLDRIQQSQTACASSDAVAFPLFGPLHLNPPSRHSRSNDTPAFDHPASPPTPPNSLSSSPPNSTITSSSGQAGPEIPIFTTLGSLHHANLKSRFSRWSSFSYPSTAEEKKAHFADVLRRFCCRREGQMSPTDATRVIQEKWCELDHEERRTGRSGRDSKVRDEYNPVMGGMRNYGEVGA